MTPDQINASFEAASTIFVLNNCRVLLKDKQTKGFSFLGMYFFVGWGLSNCFIFYPAVHQIYSWIGAFTVTSANALYMCMALYYRYFYDPSSETFA